MWNPDLADAHDYASDWIESPGNQEFENGFKTQWEEFIRHVVEDAPNHYDFLAGARGVLLAEEGLRSSAEGRRIDLPVVTLDGASTDAASAADASAPASAQAAELTGAR